MTQFQCIYCKQIKSKYEFSKTEHVLPRSFGLFINNLTLNNHVCDNCNKYFGDNLEIVLARDTFEGLSRFNFGVKKPKDYQSLGSRSKTKIKVDEGPFKGAYVFLEYSQKIGDLIIRPFQQIGLFHPMTAKYSFFLLDEIPEKSELLKQGFDLTKHETIIAIGLTVEEANEVLLKKDISNPSWGDISSLTPSDGKWDVVLTTKLDSILPRTIAKIAFNYFCYWTSPDLVLHVGFDEIRSYIRQGDQPSSPIVSISDRPILSDEPIIGKRRLGHIITINWSQKNQSIISKVSLFNQNTYLVVLSTTYFGRIENIPKGHFFNVSDNKIYPLMAKKLK